MVHTHMSDRTAPRNHEPNEIPRHTHLSQIIPEMNLVKDAHAHQISQQRQIRGGKWNLA